MNNRNNIPTPYQLATLATLMAPIYEEEPQDCLLRAMDLLDDAEALADDENDISKDRNRKKRTSK